MNDIATHVRIFDPSPSDDTVTKRASAVKDIAARLTKGTQVDVLLQVADDIVACVPDVSNMPEGFATEIAGIINKHSNAYVRDGHELELQVCILLGASQMLGVARPVGGGLSRVDVVAAGLWSGLGFQAPLEEPKLEQLRASVLGRARKWAEEAAEAARKRAPIPDAAWKLPDGADVTAATDAAKAGVTKLVNALRDNASLDREEIDILWWALNDWSPALNTNLSRSTALTGAIVGGIELGALLRRLPADAHRHLLLRHVQGAKRYTLAEVVEATAEVRSALNAALRSNAILSKCPNVLPLLTAVLLGEVGGLEGPGKLTAQEWGARALLESALINLPQMLNGV